MNEQNENQNINLIKKKIHIDYQKMYEETIKSGDIEGAKLMKKMIRKLSSRIVSNNFLNENNKKYNSDDIDDFDVDDIKQYDDDYKFIDDIIDNVDNIEIEILTNKLGNIDVFYDNNMDYDNSKINKIPNHDINNLEEKNKIKEYHKEKFREIKKQNKIKKEKFKNSKFYFRYKKLYNDSISNGDLSDAKMLKKIVKNLFE